MTKKETQIISSHIKTLEELSENLKSAFEMSRQVQMRLAYEQIDLEITKLLTLNKRKE